MGSERIQRASERIWKFEQSPWTLVPVHMSVAPTPSRFCETEQGNGVQGSAYCSASLCAADYKHHKCQALNQCNILLANWTSHWRFWLVSLDFGLRASADFKPWWLHSFFVPHLSEFMCHFTCALRKHIALVLVLSKGLCIHDKVPCPRGLLLQLRFEPGTFWT